FTLGCAQNADGSPRDASEINWYQDRDDEHPTSGPQAPPSPKVHPFFTGSAKPVGKIAGACCSARATRPSSHIMDPNNAESSVTAVKCKAASVGATSRFSLHYL
ncbi:hypothetical protein B0H17DRAFT_666984, partial [Mycena rosella]